MTTTVVGPGVNMEPYRILLRDISVLEKELLTNDQNPNNNGSSSGIGKDEIQNRMILCCKELILLYPQIATSKNIDNILWKHCHYRSIEAYRKRIRQLSTLLEKPTAAAGYSRTPANDLQFQEHRQHLMKISSGLNQYLSQSAAFYESFLMQLEHRIESKSAEREAAVDSATQTDLSLDIDAHLRSIYFCLLYLGDIARYAELHSVTNKPKDWSAASQYYLRARQVLPALGNSHNQLAVLCSYKATQSSPLNLTPGMLAPPSQSNPPPSPASIELNAIYHYCRSILVAVPFQTGIENLKLMFEKSAKRTAATRQLYPPNPSSAGLNYDEYDRRIPQAYPTQQQQIYQQSYYPQQQHQQEQQRYHQGKKSKQHNSAENHSNLSDFISLFLSLMNEIFSLSLSELSLVSMLWNCQQESDFKQGLHSDHQQLVLKVSTMLASLLPKILDEFELLFSNITTPLSAEILMRILTISLFAIHFTRHELRRRSKQFSNPISAIFNPDTFFDEMRESRFVSESLGITCLFSLVSRLALKLCLNGNVDKTKRRLMIRVVQFVSVFCDWGRMNPDYLHSVTSPASAQQQSSQAQHSQGIPSSQFGNGESNLLLSSLEILRSSGEQLRGENRTRSSLRVTVADMKAYLAKLFSNHPTDEGGNKLGPASLPLSGDSVRPVFGHALSLPLPEYIELRGYIPFRDYEIFFRGISLKTMISMSYPSEKESASITRRLQNIEEFIDFSLAPPVPPPPVIPPPPTPAEIKQRLREERKAKKDPKKKDKKLKKQQKGKDKTHKAHSKGSRREGLNQGDSDSSAQPRPQVDNQDFRYLPNDEDFPDIRKFNEVSSTKQRGESLYAAALAAVRGNGDSQRHRKEGGNDENEDSGRESDEEEDNDNEDEDYSQGSSMSELETDEEEEEAPSAAPASHSKINSANVLEDEDLDDADDVIVFQPAFSQQQQQPSPIGRPMSSSPSKSSSGTPLHAPHTRQQQRNREEIVEGENAGIDLESLAYLQALHKKNTEQGWLTQHNATPAAAQQSLPPMEFHEPRGSHPFQLDQVSNHDYWSPHGNSEMGLLNDFEYNGTHSDYSAWPTHRSFSAYDKFSAPVTSAAAPGDVAPPPGFMELPALPLHHSSHSHSDDYQMNSTAASFLPTSLRQSTSSTAAASSPQPSSSRLSMFYGSDPVPEQRSWNRGPPAQPYQPSGYQSQRHNGT